MIRFVVLLYEVALRLYSSACIGFLRVLGLKAGKKVLLGGLYHWPWQRMSQLTLEDNVRLGNAGKFIISDGNGCVVIGKGSYLSGVFTILAGAPIKIGANCVFSFNVSIVSTTHRLGVGINPVASGMLESKPIIIGDRCFIGCNTTILAGATLGDDCIVGAGAVVTRAFPNGSVIGGVPARILKRQPN